VQPDLLKPPFLVTTCPHPEAALRERARGLADNYHLPYESRGSRTLADLRRFLAAEGVLVVGREGLRYAAAEATLTFHPGMAKVRLHNVRSGRGEPLLAAMDVRPTDKVLDCTLGLAGDALVVASALGNEGSVEGLEVVLPIYLVVADGLARYGATAGPFSSAARRIGPRWAEASAFLADCAPGDYDVIYLDPFFERPVAGSCAIAPLRTLGAHDRRPLGAAALRATEVARRCVVVKGSHASRLFEELPVQRVVAGRHSNVAYAVLEAR
jgi:16S rRNA (guanine1516-N2)-methyltransferase